MALAVRRTVMTVLVTLSVGLTAGCNLGQFSVSSASLNTPDPPPPAEVEDKTLASGTECPVGDYSVTSIDAIATARIGDKELAFRGPATGLTFSLDRDGGWTMTGKEASASVTLAGTATVTAQINGVANGTFAAAGTQYDFTLADSSGDARISAPGIPPQQRPMQEIAEIIAPAGATTLSCLSDTATMKSESGTLRLVGLNTTPGAAGLSEPPAATNAIPPVEVEGPMMIATSKRTAAYNCTETAGTLTITGADSTLTLAGHCPSVTVTGSRNIITIASVTALTVSGNDNTITWKSSTGTGPEINDTGGSNTITQGDGAAATDTVETDDTAAGDPADADPGADNLNSEDSTGRTDADAGDVAGTDASGDDSSSTETGSGRAARSGNDSADSDDDSGSSNSDGDDE